MNVYQQRFTPLQQLLHWVMAACVLAMLFIGVGMVSSTEPKYLRLISIHVSLGITVLVLALIRLAVRLRYGAPPLPADMPAGMKTAARVSHYLLYIFMISMPLVGWAMLSTADYPIVLFGSVRLPAILSQSDGLHTFFLRLHITVAFLFFALILLHVGAALMHALIRRDGVFQTMVPAGRAARSHASDGRRVERA